MLLVTMGACLRKFKRNSVSPSAAEENIRKRMSQTSTKHQKPDPIKPADMIQQLKDAEIEESRITTGGVSFTLNLRDGVPSRMPSRLADRLDGVITPSDDNKEVKYNAEEKELLAELLRNDILREKSEKAHRSIARSKTAQSPMVDHDITEFG